MRNRRVSFHTRSIAFKSGLYGGKKSSRIASLWASSHGVSWRLLCHEALSAMTTMVRPFRLCRFSWERNAWKVSAVKVFIKQLANCPSDARTAPNTAMDFRVGACSTTGSLSSGGIHILHRVPCCWKWHSSWNHTSMSSRATNWRSFFICPLGLRVGLRNKWARFPQAKAQLFE